LAGRIYWIQLVYKPENGVNALFLSPLPAIRAFTPDFDGLWGEGKEGELVVIAQCFPLRAA
jgi:hypothetical protein